MPRILVLLVTYLLLPIVATAQAPTRIAIRAGNLIDARSEKPLENPLIQVEGGWPILALFARVGMPIADLLRFLTFLAHARNPTGHHGTADALSSTESHPFAKNAKGWATQVQAGFKGWATRGTFPQFPETRQPFWAPHFVL